MVPEHTSIVLQTDVSTTIERTVSEVVTFLPRLVGAVVVLLIGWVVGVAIRKAVERLTDSVGLDSMTMDTPLGHSMGGFRRAVALGAGIALGWGGHSSVAQTIDNWMGSARSAMPEPSGSAATAVPPPTGRVVGVTTLGAGRVASSG